MKSDDHIWIDNHAWKFVLVYLAMIYGLFILIAVAWGPPAR